MTKKMLPASEIPSPEIVALIADAVSRDHPRHKMGSMVVCESNATAVVVRVFLPVPTLKPSPYCIYKVDLPTKRIRKLTGEEGSRYRIKNYK